MFGWLHKKKLLMKLFWQWLFYWKQTKLKKKQKEKIMSIMIICINRIFLWKE